MLTKMKNDGAVSTAGQSVKKGNKGRLSLYGERTEDGYSVEFRDYGNYGKERWSASFPVSADDLADMIMALQELISGETDTTEDEFVTSAPEPEVEAEVADEQELAPFPADETVEDIDQLSV